MNEKGFTLIELLAVTVILAIIALITTPIVLNIIEDSKKSAFAQTGNGIVDAAEYYYMNEMSDGVKPTENKVFTFNGSSTGIEGLEFDGEIPKEGTLTVDVNGNVELVAHNNQYCITKGYGDNEVTIKEYDGDCEIPSICTLVNDADNSETITPGDKYQCKVKENMETGFEDGYYFYVLSLNEDGTTNLIMDRNMYYDSENDIGLAATSPKSGLVEWQVSTDNAYGPVTAMDYLYQATKDWKNVPNVVVNYTDEGAKYGMIKSEDALTTITKKDGTHVTVLTNKTHYSNLKARMPYRSEVSDYDSEKKNQYLYDNLRADCYESYLERIPTSCNSAGYIYGVVAEGISYLDGAMGYWTLSSDADNSAKAWGVYYWGALSNKAIDFSYYVCAARPVITLKI